MVEKITAEALQTYTGQLAAAGVLEDNLQRELQQLISALDGFSNWTEAGQYFRKNAFSVLAGMGPMSKFLRTLAYGLEKACTRLEELKVLNLRLSRFQLLDASSGCSDFRGKVEWTAANPSGSEITLLEGGFVWDCAAHGRDQPRAAQELGYLCMVSFPDFSLVTVSTLPATS